METTLTDWGGGEHSVSDSSQILFYFPTSARERSVIKVRRGGGRGGRRQPRRLEEEEGEGGRGSLVG